MVTVFKLLTLFAAMTSTINYFSWCSLCTVKVIAWWNATTSSFQNNFNLTLPFRVYCALIFTISRSKSNNIYNVFYMNFQSVFICVENKWNTFCMMEHRYQHSVFKVQRVWVRKENPEEQQKITIGWLTQFIYKTIYIADDKGGLLIPTWIIEHLHYGQQKLMLSGNSPSTFTGQRNV